MPIVPSVVTCERSSTCAVTAVRVPLARPCRPFTLGIVAPRASASNGDHRGNTAATPARSIAAFNEGIATVEATIAVSAHEPPAGRLQSVCKPGRKPRISQLWQGKLKDGPDVIREWPSWPPYYRGSP